MLDNNFLLALHKDRVAGLRAEADRYRLAAAVRRCSRHRRHLRWWPRPRHESTACRS